MDLPPRSEVEAISGQILGLLSPTKYACSSLTQLGTRAANFVFRGILAQSFTNDAGIAISSVIIKHSTEQNFPLCIERCVFDEYMLNALAGFHSSSTAESLVTTPRLFLFDQSLNVQVLEDFADAVVLKWKLFSPNADKILTGHTPASIGHSLGSWLRAFHSWTSAPAQGPLRARMVENDPIRKLKYSFSFGSFLSVLKSYPQLLDGYRETLITIQNAVAGEVVKHQASDDEAWGVIHGDFWSGNVLFPDKAWQEQEDSGVPKKLFIIDWEFAQFGHRSYDLGQMIGDLYERLLFRSEVFFHVEIATSVMESFIGGYGRLTDEMAFRTAIYVGVHLIGWHHRRPAKAPSVAPEMIVAGLTLARDFIVKGWQEDKRFFANTVLASLFANSGT